MRSGGRRTVLKERGGRRAGGGRWLALAALALALGCAPGIPSIDGEPGAPPSPASLWPAPPPAQTPAPPPVAPVSAPATAALAADSAGIAGVRQLSLMDVVALALANNPATRQSWAQARAAADVYGASRGAIFPTITGDVTAARTGSSGGRGVAIGAGGTAGNPPGGGSTRTTGAAVTGTVTELTPSLNMSYLVFDLGGRSGSIEAARQRAIAADLVHNATVRDVVLQVESSLFSFLANRALRDAERTAVTEAEADLAAARERYRVGVAAVQDVLQTQTALSQARFQLEALEASVMSSQGNLAVSMGLHANTRFTVPEVAASDSVAAVGLSVDALVARAIALRPELAQLRAQAAALAAEVRVARSAGYPALALSSSASRVHSTISSPTNTYSIVLGLQIPIFSGFTQQYDVRAAREQYAAGLAQVASQEQQITLEVFTSYYALNAAARRVRTASELLADAARSADVAAGRYRAGVGTIVDVILARSALATARAEAIQARWEWRTALAQLAHDTGALDLAGRPDLPLTPDTTGVRR